MGVIFITHDMGVVAEMADRVLVMYRGDKVEDGAVGAGVRRSRSTPTRARCCRPCRGWARCSGTDLPARFELLQVDAAGVSVSDRSPQDTVRRDVAADPAREGPGDALRPRSGLFGRVHAPGACGGSSQLRPARRRDAGAGRRIGLRQVDHRPLAAAPGRQPGRRDRVRRAATSLALPQARRCRRCGATSSSSSRTRSPRSTRA